MSCYLELQETQNSALLSDVATSTTPQSSGGPPSCGTAAPKVGVAPANPDEGAGAVNSGDAATTPPSNHASFAWASADGQVGPTPVLLSPEEAALFAAITKQLLDGLDPNSPIAFMLAAKVRAMAWDSVLVERVKKSQQLLITPLVEQQKVLAARAYVVRTQEALQQWEQVAERADRGEELGLDGDALEQCAKVMLMHYVRLLERAGLSPGEGEPFGPCRVPSSPEEMEKARQKLALLPAELDWIPQEELPSEQEERPETMEDNPFGFELQEDPQPEPQDLALAEMRRLLCDFPRLEPGMRQVLLDLLKGELSTCRRCADYAAKDLARQQATLQMASEAALSAHAKQLKELQALRHGMERNLENDFAYYQRLRQGTQPRRKPNRPKAAAPDCDLSAAANGEQTVAAGTDALVSALNAAVSRPVRPPWMNMQYQETGDLGHGTDRPEGAR